MQAIILAGGKGKRLKPLTDYIPKSLVPLNDITIIEWQIKYLKKFGVDEVIICTGYKSNMIENFLSTKNNLGIKIIFSKEKTPLGTGGAIKKAGFLVKDKSFFVINGDIITNIDLKKLIKSSNTIASIELRTKFGIMEIKNNKISQFKEKEEIPGVWMNAGLYHLQKEILKDLPKTGEIEKKLFPVYAQQGKLNVIKFKDVKWYSIDSFKDIEESSVEINDIIK